MRLLLAKSVVRIPSSGKHCSLQALVKQMVQHAGPRKEAQKRGIGSNTDKKDYRTLDLHNGNY